MYTSELENTKKLISEIYQYTPRAYVLTFGCQQNEADSEKMSGIARDMGYDITHNPEDADLILVNTCAIREHAEQRALSIIGSFKHIKAKNKNLIIGVGGCMTAQKHRMEQLKQSYPYVDIVFGTASIHRIPELIYTHITSDRRIFREDDLNGGDYETIAEGIPIHRSSKNKAAVSIMYGCNNFCSYCIVPYVRGRERSRNSANIIAEAEELVRDGCRDITLLGQNVNSYGRGLDEEIDIADLLRKLNGIDGDFKLRFMTSHPKDASEKLIEAMADCEKVAKHFHLPLQSGSDSVLREMNRYYDTAKYLKIVESLRAHMPDITITSDIIVGFPTETEEDFQGTLNMLREVKFDMIYSFIYSPRKGTPAAEMDNQISDEVKGERFSRLLAVQNEIANAKNRARVGQVMRTLSEGKSRTDETTCTGRTDGGTLVHFVDNGDTEGKFVNIKITRADTFALFGEIQ